MTKLQSKKPEDIITKQNLLLQQKSLQKISQKLQLLLLKYSDLEIHNSLFDPLNVRNAEMSGCSLTWQT